MKHLLTLLLLTALATLSSCTSNSRGMTANEARNSYENVHAALKHGETTYEQMKAKFGPPSEYRKTEEGFSARWIERRSISYAPGFDNSSLSAFDEGASVGRYHHNMTYVSTLEANFNQDGTLKNYFVQSDMK